MNDQDSSKIVYVTGCLGFIGLHVTQMCLSRGWHVIGVDKITYASNTRWLDRFREYRNFVFLQQDINDLGTLLDCDYVINTAAETHVDNSIMDSDVFVHSNINGVHRILELIRRRPNHRQPTLLHFSTDEVYGDIESGSHDEQTALRPSNPYSASKAAADMLITAWNRTYGSPFVIVRPTNNYGIGQYVEKLIPKSIKYLSLGRKIDLHDSGMPRRVWLHANDTARAVMTIIDSGMTNEIYNISGNTELPNREVLQSILLYSLGPEAAQSWEEYIIPSHRVGQDVRYSVDDTKLKNLGWQPQAIFDHELKKIIAYYTDTSNLINQQANSHRV